MSTQNIQHVEEYDRPCPGCEDRCCPCWSVPGDDGDDGTRVFSYGTANDETLRAYEAGEYMEATCDANGEHEDEFDADGNYNEAYGQPCDNPDCGYCRSMSA
jgi:hypothetical protein